MAEIWGKGVWGGAISLVVFGGCFAGLFAISDTPEVALIILPCVAAAVRLPTTRVRLDITGFFVDDDMDFWNSRQRTLLGFLPRPGKRNQADDICDQLNPWLRTGA